jgi:UDP-N-acetylmuramoyl-tripeptide--D-alanyl-D-alanine ligase
MTYLYTCDEILNATRGELIGDKNWQASGFEMDSREVRTGDIFVALQPEGGTEKYRSAGQDGHKFIPSAIQNGAVAVIVSHKMDIDIPQIIVPDTFKAMQDLGQFARNRAPLKQVIAITGSVGKTGVRDMVNTAFTGANFKTHASIKSYNNIIGVPFSLATIPSDSEIGVFEVGMNYADEITPLSNQVRPSIAIITWIAEVHIENFDDGMDGIINAKSEVFAGLQPDGCAILPRDNDHYSALVKTAQGYGVQTIYSFGEHIDCDARLVDYTLTANGTKITANIMGEHVNYNLKIAGKHIAINSLSALLVVKLSDGDIQLAAKSLSIIDPLDGRGKRHIVNGVTFIDETYNASPVAVRASLNVLKMIEPAEKGKRICILGDMRELGDIAVQEHIDLASSVIDAGVDIAHTCGELMQNLRNALPENLRGYHCDTSDEFLNLIPKLFHKNDVVLVKGSNGVNLKIIIDAITAPPK